MILRRQRRVCRAHARLADVEKASSASKARRERQATGSTGIAKRDASQARCKSVWGALLTRLSIAALQMTVLSPGTPPAWPGFVLSAGIFSVASIVFE